MTKNDLIEKIALLMPSKKEATIVVNKLFEEMLSAIINGEKVVITGFGSFNLITTKTKKGRNPKTGETIILPPGKKIKFKQSIGLDLFAGRRVVEAGVDVFRRAVAQLDGNE